MPMYTIPLFLSAITAWPIVGAVIFTLIDPDTDELYHFVKKHGSKIVREWHIFVWPYVLTVWYIELKRRKSLE